ncbi:unnamed protein product, partial [marine sediment metagenome]
KRGGGAYNCGLMLLCVRMLEVVGVGKIVKTCPQKKLF